MAHDPAAAERRRYPELGAALQRNLVWACDFAIAGDLESAIEALRDAHAAAAETRAVD
jgi:hypothetical protein